MHYDKDLVAEQSGLGISLIGLLLALFIGLAVRAVVAPEKVQAHLQKAISHIHPDLEISFREAYVSFADGSFPDLAVIIKGGLISSNKKCWLAPVMEINQLKLPLSWGHLARGEIYIHQVVVDTVNLNLRNAPEKCEENAGRENSENKKTNPGKDEPRMPAQFSGKASKAAEPIEFKNVRRQNPIDTLNIGSLKINYLPVAFTSVEIKNFKLHLRSHEPRWIEVTGQMNLAGDGGIGDFSSYANLKVDAIDGEKASISASAVGILREGHYDLSMTSKPNADEFDLLLDLQHMPVSEIIPFLKKYRLLAADIGGRQAWISGKASMRGKTSEIRQTPISMQNIKLEGDLGEINLPHAHIESVEPLKYKPMEFQIKNLNMKKFLEFLGKAHPTPIFASLGNFSGTALFNNPEDLKLRGDYSGLEFIFSNRGSRQIQNMQLISGELNLKNQMWNINLDRIKPVDGIFDGQVLIKADRDFKSVQVDAKMNELSLAPQVQILMTGGGSLGSLNGRLKAELEKDNLKSLSGQLKWDQLLIEGIRVYRPRAQIQTQGADFLLEVSALELEMQGNHPLTGSLLSPVTSVVTENASNTATGKPFIARSLSAKIRTQKLRSLNWNSVQMMTAKGPLKSQGAWSQEAVLVGEIALGTGAKAMNWNISGTRNEPRLTLKNGSSR